MPPVRPGEQVFAEVDGSWWQATAIVDQGQRALVRLGEGPARGTFVVVGARAVRAARDGRPDAGPATVVVDVELGSSPGDARAPGLFVSHREVVWTA